MSIIANNTGGDFKPVPAGTYVARCFSMIQIGTVVEEYNGESKEQNKVRISWELPTEKKVFAEEKGEQPYSVSKDFTLSMHEKSNLRKFLESWRGKGFTEDEAKSFDVTKLLGKPCMISVIHKVSKQGKTYAEISSVSTLPKGLECPEQINPNFEFTFCPFDQVKFDSLAEWIKDKIKTSKEYKLVMQPGHTETEESTVVDDDLPF
jgi:hypothetical protein